MAISIKTGTHICSMSIHIQHLEHYFMHLFYTLPYFCEDKIEQEACLCFETGNFQAVQQLKLMKGHTNILDMCHTAG